MLQPDTSSPPEFTASLEASSAFSSVGSGLNLVLQAYPGLYSYLADITSVETRTTRIGIIDIFLFAGVPAGTFLSAYVYQSFGFYGIFLLVYVMQVDSNRNLEIAKEHSIFSKCAVIENLQTFI